MRYAGSMHTLVGGALALLLGAGVPGLAAAQDASPPQLYQVEIIIFTNEDFDPGEELFVAPPITPRSDVEVPQRRDLSSAALEIELLPGSEDGLGGVQDGRPQTNEAGGREQAPSGVNDTNIGDTNIGPDPRDALVELEQRPLRDLQPLGMRRLGTDELRLGGAYATLNRLGAYTPVAHVGWVQEGLPEGQAVTFDLSALGRFTPSGTIQLYTTRFLRLGVDVEYQPRRGDRSTVPARNPFELAEITPLQRYRLVEDRRVRTGEVHYFDHPAFGIIATVRPQARETQDASVPTPAP